jgi:proteasome lid subunit RPN8/RPN11
MWSGCGYTQAASGLAVLGTIHSHPECCPFPSETDNDSARDNGEHLYGILEIRCSPSGRKRTRLAWWPTHHQLEKVKYFQPSGD